MQQLMPHQQRIVDANPRKALLNWEARTGKSLPAARWIEHPCRAGERYIICTKQNKKEWQGYGTGAAVLTKEEFRKVASTLRPSAIVVDEAHNFASPLFVKGRSQMAAALYDLVRRSPEMDVMLLTATPVRNSAWSLHTLLCYLGVYYDWQRWRAEFFELKKMPYLRFPAWLPRKDWRARLDPILRKHTDIVALQDIVADLPPPVTQVIKVPPASRYVEPEDEVVTWTHEHRHEQGGKLAYIREMGYKKLLIFVHYTDEIDRLAFGLADLKPVYVLDGRTKDAEKVKALAQSAESCYFIVQSSMGFGFDGYMFGATVFASQSHSNVHHTQALGRPRHIVHVLVPQIYYLIGGRWDKRIMDTVLSGQDFNPHAYHD